MPDEGGARARLSKRLLDRNSATRSSTVPPRATGSKPAGAIEMSELLIADSESLRRITMNRPDKRNALTRAMYAGMADALREAASRPTMRAVLLTGGPQCFTAGNDIADFPSRQDAPGEGPLPGPGFLAALREFPKPLVPPG